MPTLAPTECAIRVVPQRDSEQRATGGIFHSSVDASINQLSDNVVSASNTARFLIFSAVIVIAAVTVIIATKGELGRVKTTAAGGSV